MNLAHNETNNKISSSSFQPYSKQRQNLVNTGNNVIQQDANKIYKNTLNLLIDNKNNSDTSEYALLSHQNMENKIYIATWSMY